MYKVYVFYKDAVVGEWTFRKVTEAENKIFEERKDKDALKIIFVDKVVGKTYNYIGGRYYEIH